MEKKKEKKKKLKILISESWNIEEKKERKKAIFKFDSSFRFNTWIEHKILFHVHLSHNKSYAK